MLMRKDPPFDMEYVYSTYLLELAQEQGARIFNNPRAIRDCNEKMTIARFPQFTAPTLVTRHAHLIHEFLVAHGDIILKPLDGMGGTSVFRVHAKDPNLNVIIETVTHYGAAHDHGAALHSRDRRRRQARAADRRQTGAISCSRAYPKPVKPAATSPPAAPALRVS